MFSSCSSSKYRLPSCYRWRWNLTRHTLIYVASWLVILASMLCLVSTPAAAQTCAAPNPPHIVYIMMDDLGYGSLGPYGSGDAGEEIETPEIQDFVDGDSLAVPPVKGACRMTQYYVSAAVCSPSRVTVLTGQDPRTFNVREALHTGKFPDFRYSDVGIPDYVATLPEMFQDAGYRTVHIGKWHVGGIEKIADGTDVSGEFTPAAMGFEEWWVRVPSKSKQGNGSGYWLEWVENHLGVGLCINCPGQNCSSTCTGTGRPQGGIHQTKYFVDRAKDVLALYSSGTPPAEPLFLNLWLRAPHSPYNSPNVPDGNPGWERYKGLVEYADEQIGELLDEIQQHLGDNTLVFITSDNGAANTPNPPGNITDIGATFPNGMLAGKKGSLLEGGLRVPMMIRGPGVDCGETPFPGASFDLFPTLAEILGCDVPDEDFLGQSLVAQLSDPLSAPQERDRPLFHEGGRGPDLVVRDGRWKYHGCRPFDILIDMSDCGGATCDEGQDPTQPYLFTEACGPIAPPTVDNPMVLERLQDLFLDWRERSTEIDWSPVSPRDDVHLRGQIFEFTDANSTGGQFKICSPSDSDCNDPLLNFHDATFVISLKVRPNDPEFGNGVENSWLVGKNNSWNLVLTPAGHARVNFTVERGGVAEEIFTVTSAEPLASGRWNHLLVEFFRQGGFVTANLYLNGAQNTFACDRDPADPASDVPPYCSASEAIAPNDKPVILGAIANGSGALERPFYGGLSDLRMFTTRHYSESSGSSRQRDRLNRQEIAYDIVSSLGGVDYSGDVFSFTAGQITLCAPDENETCTTDHPVFEAGDGFWTFNTAIRPTAIPTSDRALIAGKNDAWRLYLMPAGALRVQVLGGCSNCFLDTGSGLVSIDKWTHLSLVIGRSDTGERELELYVNGESVATHLPGGMGAGSKPVVLGARGAGGGALTEEFSGDLAGVRLFFDALESTAVARLGRNEIPWQVMDYEGSASMAHGVFFFPQEKTAEADQIELCGPDFLLGSGMTGCSAADNARLDVSEGPFALSIDVRPDVNHPADFARIVGKDGSWQLHRDHNGFLKLRIFPESGDPVTITGSFVPEGVWSTVGFRLLDEQAGQPRQATVFLIEEGQETIEHATSMTFDEPVDFSPNKELVLGSHAGGKRFHGAMKNLRLYARPIDSNSARLLGIR